MQLNYELLVSDMDGTLLNDQSQLAAATKQAIARYQQAGGQFTIATGRSLIECEPFRQELALELPVILCNGAVLYFPQTKEIRVIHTLAHNTVDQLLTDILAIHPELNLLLFTSTQIYALQINADKVAELARIGIETVPFTTLDQIDEPLLKIQMISRPQDGQTLFDLLSRKGLHDVCDFVQSHEYYFEILPKGISKGSTLQKLNELLEIPATRTAAIGDQCNDIAMLEHAGLAATVANAHHLAKQHADVQVPSNDQDGVAYFIDEILLKPATHK